MLQLNLQFFGGRGSSGGNKASSAVPTKNANLSKNKQAWANSLKEKTNAELSSMLYNTSGLYTKKDLQLIQSELDSRRAARTPAKWDKDVQDWFNAQMRAARAGGAGVDTMVGIEANLRDQANRLMRNRTK